MAFRERVSDWWQGISPRERRIVAVGAIAVPLTLVIWLGMAIKGGLDKVEKRNDRLRRAVSVLADLRVSGVDDVADDVTDNMPTAPISLDTYLAEAATKAGIGSPGTTPRGQPLEKNGFVTSTVSVTLNDLTVQQLKDFLQHVEGDSRYVAVRTLTITRDREKEKLDARLDISTFSKQVPAAGGGDAEAGSASGSGKDN